MKDERQKEKAKGEPSKNEGTRLRTKPRYLITYHLVLIAENFRGAISWNTN
jgi:hypothetical protein